MPLEYFNEDFFSRIQTVTLPSSAESSSPTQLANGLLYVAKTLYNLAPELEFTGTPQDNRRKLDNVIFELQTLLDKINRINQHALDFVSHTNRDLAQFTADIYFAQLLMLVNFANQYLVGIDAEFADYTEQIEKNNLHTLAETSQAAKAVLAHGKLETKFLTTLTLLGSLFCTLSVSQRHWPRNLNRLLSQCLTPDQDDIFIAKYLGFFSSDEAAKPVLQPESGNRRVLSSNLLNFFYFIFTRFRAIQLIPQTHSGHETDPFSLMLHPSYPSSRINLIRELSANPLAHMLFTIEEAYKPSINRFKMIFNRKPSEQTAEASDVAALVIELHKLLDICEYWESQLSGNVFPEITRVTMRKFYLANVITVFYLMRTIIGWSSKNCADLLFNIIARTWDLLLNCRPYFVYLEPTFVAKLEAELRCRDLSYEFNAPSTQDILTNVFRGDPLNPQTLIELLTRHTTRHDEFSFLRTILAALMAILKLHHPDDDPRAVERKLLNALNQRLLDIRQTNSHVILNALTNLKEVRTHLYLLTRAANQPDSLLKHIQGVVNLLCKDALNHQVDLERAKGSAVSAFIHNLFTAELFSVLQFIQSYLSTQPANTADSDYDDAKTFVVNYFASAIQSCTLKPSVGTPVSAVNLYLLRMIYNQLDLLATKPTSGSAVDPAEYFRAALVSTELAEPDKSRIQQDLLEAGIYAPQSSAATDPAEDKFTTENFGLVTLQLQTHLKRRFSSAFPMLEKLLSAEERQSSPYVVFCNCYAEQSKDTPTFRTLPVDEAIGKAAEANRQATLEQLHKQPNNLIYIALSVSPLLWRVIKIAEQFSQSEFPSEAVKDLCTQFSNLLQQCKSLKSYLKIDHEQADIANGLIISIIITAFSKLLLVESVANSRELKLNPALVRDTRKFIKQLAAELATTHPQLAEEIQTNLLNEIPKNTIHKPFAFLSVLQSLLNQQKIAALDLATITCECASAEYQRDSAYVAYQYLCHYFQVSVEPDRFKAVFDAHMQTLDEAAKQTRLALELEEERIADQLRAEKEALDAERAAQISREKQAKFEAREKARKLAEAANGVGAGPAPDEEQPRQILTPAEHFLLELSKDKSQPHLKKLKKLDEFIAQQKFDLQETAELQIARAQLLFESQRQTTEVKGQDKINFNNQAAVLRELARQCYIKNQMDYVDLLNHHISRLAGKLPKESRPSAFEAKPIAITKPAAPSITAAQSTTSCTKPPIKPTAVETAAATKTPIPKAESPTKHKTQAPATSTEEANIRFIPVPNHVNAILVALKSTPPKEGKFRTIAFVFGGYPRDAIINALPSTHTPIKPADIDIMCLTDLKKLTDSERANYLKKIKERLSELCQTKNITLEKSHLDNLYHLKIDNESFEIVFSNKEKVDRYFTNCDFKCNTAYMNADGRTVGHFDTTIADIENRTLTPVDSKQFFNDPVRILRTLNMILKGYKLNEETDFKINFDQFMVKFRALNAEQLKHYLRGSTNIDGGPPQDKAPDNQYDHFIKRFRSLLYSVVNLKNLDDENTQKQQQFLADSLGKTLFLLIMPANGVPNGVLTLSPIFLALTRPEAPNAFRLFQPSQPPRVDSACAVDLDEPTHDSAQP